MPPEADFQPSFLGITMATNNQLLDDFCLWLELNEGRSGRTAQKYRGYLAILEAFMRERQLTLAIVTGTDLEAFTGLYMHERGQTPRSRRAVVSAVKKYFKWLVRTGALKTDPAAAVPYPSAGRPLPVPMEAKFAERLLMAPGMKDFLGRRDTAILSLFIGCGLRISGLVALNESNLIFYPDENNRERERLALRVTEKGGVTRVVPAPDDCWALIRAYLGDGALDEIDRTLPNGDQVLFVSTMNRAISPDKYHGEKRRISVRSVFDMVARRGKAAGVPINQLHPHSLRHLYGTELAEADVDLLVRQALMGHRSVSSTKIYTHLAQRKLREAVDKANPFRHVTTPVAELLREMHRAK